MDDDSSTTDTNTNINTDDAASLHVDQTASVIHLGHHHHQRPNPEDECHCGSARCQEIVLSRELDTILNPRVIFVSAGQLACIWPLLTNRQMEPAAYLAHLAEFRTERHCGLTWPPNYVAYRCRTCSKSPSMSICCDCFRAGDHEGHDYNMFKSRSGGACDCGYSIINESGHCSRHGKNATARRDNEQVPESMICAPRRSLPRLIHRLAIGLRRSHVDICGEIDIYIDCLSRIANSCATLRGLMIDTLISEQVYSSQIQVLSNHPDKDVSKTINEGLKKLKRERKGLISFKLPEHWNSTPIYDINAFCDNLTLTSFLDELIFWTVVFEFPQKLVCFLLGFLMDDRYKDVFARAFVNYYPRIVMILASIKGEPRRNSRDSYDQLSLRISQISLQLYNDAYLTKTLCEKEHTLNTIIYCLRVALEGSPTDGLRGVLKSNPLCQTHNNDSPKMVCYDNLIIRDSHLQSFTHDLISILAFEHEAKRLVGDRNLLNSWIEMLSYFQTMSPYKRALNEHTPYETGPQISLFTIEAEFCLSPLWSILSHLRDPPSLPLTQSLLQSIHENLAIWFHRMGIGPNGLLDPYHMSFHIPLHRMFAATLRHMMFNQNRTDQEIYNFLSTNQSIFGTKYGYNMFRSTSGASIVISIKCFLKMLLLHPLQALTICYETRSSMWIRNGLTTAHQAVTYVHCAYCYSTIDLDMFLLKYCASKLNPNYFLKLLMSRFHAWKWLSYKSGNMMNNISNDMRRAYHFNILPEQIIQMVENSLTVIIQLLTLSIHCNSDDREQTKQEMIALISVRDRSYSYLLDMLPDNAYNANNVENFKSLLDELTIFKPAQHGNMGNLQQGSYTLKPHVWDAEYNPIQVQYRFNQRRDYQLSLDRYFQHCKLTGKLEKRHHRSALWPPLKIPRNIGNFGHLDLSPLVDCPTLVGIIFSTIYKNLYLGDVPDTIMAYSIHLLELSLRKYCSRNNKAERKLPKVNSSFTGKYSYMELTSCPAYFGPRGEAYIKGSTIYALLNKQYEKDSLDLENYRLFPIVRHALDLAFDTTWFPFSSILDNTLVHIENVHSMSAREFEEFLKFPMDSDGDETLNDERGQQANFSGEDVPMSWCHDDHGVHDGEDIDDDDDDIDDEEDESDDEEEDEDEDDEDDDDDDDDEVVGANEGRRDSNVVEGANDIVVGMDVESLPPPQINSPEEMESLPVIQSSALSLMPVHNRTIRAEQSSTVPSEPSTQQIYPENLVTERRAILASDPRPMLPSSAQPLALEAPPGFRSGSDLTWQQQQQQSMGTAKREERSLSEVDIQARFMPFFQSRLDSHRQRARLSQPIPRQTGRRGGFRQSGGSEHPLPPYAVHNPNNAQPVPLRFTPPLVFQPTSTTTSTTTTNNNNTNTNSNNNTEAFDLNYHWHSNLISLRQSYGMPLPNYTNTPASPIGDQFSIDINHYHQHAMEPRPRQTARRSSACTLLNRVLLSRSQKHQQQHGQRTRRNRRDKMHHGESLLSLLLRLHAKYSQRARSYEFNEERAQINFMSTERSRIGDGAHFVTIVLDLICTKDPTAERRLEQLKGLIWGDKEEGEEKSGVQQDQQRQQQQLNRTLGSDYIDDKTNLLNSMDLSRQSSSSARFGASTSRLDRQNSGAASDGSRTLNSPSATLDPVERRRRAKEFQSKLMAEFANKQKAFIERYESLSQQQPTAHCKVTTTTTRGSDKIELSGTTIASGGAATSGNKSPSLADEEPINLSSKLTRETKPQQQQQQQHISDFDKQQQQQQQQQQQPRQQLTLGGDKSNVAECSGSSGSSGSGLTVVGSSITTPSANNNSSVGAASVLEGAPSSVGKIEIWNEGNNNGSGSAGGTSSSGANCEGPVYECCICGIEGPSDLANPLGQVVLLQSTSVYGHSHLRPQSERRLPCDESMYMKLRDETYAKYLERRIDLLCEHFSASSWLDSINIGAEGGVHVQSCGHYLHIECHQSYIKSLDQERPRFRHDSDEFLCPVCRQLANSVLPILSDIGRPGRLSLALVHSGNFEDQIKLIGALLERRLPLNQKELQSSAAFCAHLTKATGPQYRLVRSNASMHSLFLFLTSIARTNLETEVIVRSTTRRTKTTTAAEINDPTGASGSGCSTTTTGATTTTANQSGAAASKRSCFMLLFHVLALNAQTLINDQWFTCDQIWSHLTHRIDEKNRLSVEPMNSEVPLLLRDPTSMLLQFLFAITNSLCYQANFTCIVQILFNLTVIQSIALVLSYAKPAFLYQQQQETEANLFNTFRGDSSDNAAASSNNASGSSSTTDFRQLLALVGLNLAKLLAPTTEEPLMNSSIRDCWLRFEQTTNIGGGGCYDGNADNADKTIKAAQKHQQQQLQLHEEEESTPDDDDDQPISFLENRVKLACLPFLRAAAFLQHHLYGQDYPQLEIVDDDQLTDTRAIDTDFSTLISFLKLEAIKMEQPGSDGACKADIATASERSSSSAVVRALNWPPLTAGGQEQELQQHQHQHQHQHQQQHQQQKHDSTTGAKLIASWSAELLRFGAEFSIAARTLLVCRSLAWYRPSLMQLPHSFDDVFMFYYRKECSLCHQVPRDVAICLVCGAPICFRVSCCKDRSRSRLVHSQHCGANTAVFLAVHTSSIVVIRGNRACVWGSVYLDAHGEEDNGLQRGKPLYLVQARFELLERQWLTHSFDHKYSKPWIYLQENQ